MKAEKIMYLILGIIILIGVLKMGLFNNMNPFSSLGPIVILIIAIVLILNAMASRDIFFTKVKTGNIKFIKKGESLHRIIHDVPDYYLDDNDCFCKDKGIAKNKKSWLNNLLGIWVIGLYPVYSVHRFTVTKETGNPAGEDSHTWIIKKDPEEVDSLLFSFPRPFVLENVELESGIAINTLIVGRFRVVNPVIPVFILKGNFFLQIESILQTHVADKINKIVDYTKFVALDKSGEKGFLYDLTKSDSALNDQLRREVGIEITDISLPQYELSDATLLKATNKVAEETLLAEALRVKTKGEVDAFNLETDARVKRAREEGEAINAGILSGIEAADPNEKARAILAIRKSMAVGGKDSKINTWIEGGGNITPTKNI